MTRHVSVDVNLFVGTSDGCVLHYVLEAPISVLHNMACMRHYA
jgi:hypothetical protein